MRAFSTITAATLLASYVAALPLAAREDPAANHVSSSESMYESKPTSTMHESSSSSYENKSYETKSYDNKYSSSSSSSYHETSTQKSMETHSMETKTYEKETKSMEHSSTSTAKSTEATYGSGNSGWGNQYDDCVQKCIADHGSPSSGSWTPPPSKTEEKGNGNGATFTVIVAPSQGVLRYVPNAVNASVGDTVKFMWGANGHTVTRGSQLEMCNKTLDQPFTSPKENKSFEFTHVVDTLEPTYFFCAVGTHCQQGMWGVINPKSQTGTGAASTVIPAALASNADLANLNVIAKNATQGNEAASQWGANIDIKALPEWAQKDAMANILYTRTFLGMNKEVLTADGKVDLSATNGAPLAIPADFKVVNNAVDGANSGTPAAEAPAAPTEAAAPPSEEAPKPNGAASKAASTALLSIVAIAGAFLAL